MNGNTFSNYNIHMESKWADLYVTIGIQGLCLKTFSGYRNGDSSVKPITNSFIFLSNFLYYFYLLNNSVLLVFFKISFLLFI